VPWYALFLILAGVLAAVFMALFRALSQGPRAVLAVAAFLTATAGLIGAINALMTGDGFS
jgi:hypothetical protein